MIRKEGYYWVKPIFEDKWAIYFFDGSFWIGTSSELQDSHFTQIEETRIPAPDEVPAAIDYRDLLIKYMAQVVSCEGVAFMPDDYDLENGEVKFSEIEVKALEQIEQAVKGRYY